MVVAVVKKIFQEKLDVSHGVTTQWDHSIGYVLQVSFWSLINLLVKVIYMLCKLQLLELLCLLDHDECALTDHGCEHQCVNTHGTYMCVCDWGYRLDSDMRGCSGM